ncbi:hypothetical protein SJAG_05637 [Schizosaccharomyces japonicus yFS275]|uniref:Uncharacterized protein n=1 Tax=Schizosaccharomyces japonicus (strain yFS275 / FY16936) TaxID=402676 RepID=T0S0Y6_SCHJY|nr:hypothetical protein SJAG_05637 [Schizosaccharomyces japonicus yFS275]EQC52982.1 hypothetical protein SJAG_05637 [Schizosaccharomyces japonicus yFS275]
MRDYLIFVDIRQPNRPATVLLKRNVCFPHHKRVPRHSHAKTKKKRLLGAKEEEGDSCVYTNMFLCQGWQLQKTGLKLQKLSRTYEVQN